MTTPSRSDTVRASSIVQAWRWQHDTNGLPVSIPLLEAAETLLDALADERRKTKAVDADPELEALLDEEERVWRAQADPDDRVPLLHIAGWLGLGLTAWVVCIAVAVLICRAVT